MPEEYKGYTIALGGDAPAINPAFRSLVDDVDSQFTSRSTWVNYTPTWTTDGSSQPTLSNGSLAGRYVQNGKVLTVQGRLVIGSSTSSGSGTWRFALPTPVYASTVSFAVGSSLGYIASWGIFHAIPVLVNTTNIGVYVPANSTNNFMQLVRNADGAGTASTGYPSTGVTYPWVSGSTLTWNITYEAA
jgi:hypothetical protein